jgi:hypothetical protein
MHNKTTSITINSDRILEKFKEATALVASAGLSIPKDKVVEIMILSELGRLDPNDIAERFSQDVTKKLCIPFNSIDGKDGICPNDSELFTDKELIEKSLEVKIGYGSTK